MTSSRSEAQYVAAISGVALKDRSERARLEVTGRAPVQMLDGILTASVPPGPVAAGPGVRRGRAAYSAVLTPKGRIVTDLRVLRLGPSDGVRSASPGKAPAAAPERGTTTERLLLEVPAAGRAGLLAHLGRFLPPRLAKVGDISAGTGLLTVLGPAGPELLSREGLGLRVESTTLRALEDEDYVAVDLGGGEEMVVIRTRDVATPALDVLADLPTIRALGERLLETGAVEMDEVTWEVLRVEAGRPAFGRDMDEGTLPVEAGIHSRAIDDTKGCYTGQEVIVRIRDRGHVNRHLRGVKLGDASPSPGTELFAPEARGDSAVGNLTSVARSPRLGETLGLAYLRREILPGDRVRVGGVDGPEALVADLEGGWRPDA